MQPDHQAAGEAMRLGAGAKTALLACGLFTTIGLFSPGLLLPQIEREFATTPNVALLMHLVAAIASFAFALGAPVAGILIGRLGCRRVILPCLIVFALAGTTPALLSDLWLIVVTRVILGLALAGIFTGALVGIGGLAEPSRARMFGWFSVVGGGAAILLFPLIGELARSGWRLPFLVHLLALGVFPLVLLVPRTLGIVDRALAGPARTSREGSLLNPAMGGLLLIAAVAGMSMLVGPMLAPRYLTTVGVSDTRLLAVPVTLGSIAAVLASASYGLLNRRLGVNGVSAATMIVLGLALALAGTVGAIPVFTVAIIVASASVAVIAPNVSAAAMAFSAPSRASQAIGLANGVMFGAQLLFPFLAGWIEGWLSVRGVFLTFAAVALLIGVATAARGAIGTHRPAPAG